MPQLRSKNQGLRNPPCVIIGAGPSGLGVGRALQEAGVPFVILERQEVGASFRRWPAEMRLLTPSFPSNSFGTLDLNSIAIGTSPAFTLETEHPTGSQYADYLASVADYFRLPIRTGVDVLSVSALPGASRGGGRSGSFELQTSDGLLTTQFVVWAAGEFQYPRRSGFAGAEHCLHNSQVQSFKKLRGDRFLVIGGYESGVDAAVQLAASGKRVRVLERRSVWSSESSDPSITLSPYTWDRLMATPDGLIELIDEVEITQIERQKNRFAVVSADGHRFLTPQRPLLATGFDGSVQLVRNLFEFRDDGFPKLTGTDESTLAPGLFLTGPQVRHERLVFCFIYKFRQRFGVIAKTIASRLGIDTAPLEKYRFWGLFLDDLSCCGDECVC